MEHGSCSADHAFETENFHRFQSRETRLGSDFGPEMLQAVVDKAPQVSI